MANTSSTFLSGGGVVLTDFGGRDSGSSIVLQQDGKIVVAGESSGGGDSGFAVVRYNPDGSLDTSFGGDGKVNTDFGGFDYATSLGLQSDGKILVAGYTGISSSGGGDFALVRYNSDGTLDTSFDGDGKVTTDFGGWDRAESVTVESDGRILVAGYTGFTSSGGGDFAVVRYDSNGTLDATFGANGKVITDVGAEDSAHSVIVQSDNKIVVIGDTAISSSGASDFALVRYNADGSLDTTFGLAGKVTTDFGGGDFVGGGTVQPDGKIVVVGDSYDLANTSSGDQDFVVVRYNTDGTLDTSFDSDGKIVADFGGGDGASSVAVQVDGKIVVTGDSLPAGSSGGGDVIVVRYNADGTLDTTFSGDGVVKSAVGDESEGNGVVVQSDGRILVAGQSVSNGNADFLLMRYNADGSKALAIDFNGTPFDMAGPAETFIDFHSDSSQQGVTGYVASFTFYDLAGGAYESHLYDDNGDGKPDRYVTEPFPNGLAPSVIESGIISYDVNGQLTITPVNYHEVVSGINHNAADVGFGIFDFHVPGAGDLYYGFGAGQGDFGYGRIAYNSVGEAVGFYVIGAPEPIGFGKVTTDFGGGQDLGFSVATQSDGKILVAGISLNAGNPDFALVRYNADGTLDSSFGGGNGKITTDFGRSDAGMCLAVQSNGKILVLGQSWDEGTGTNLNGANNHNGKFALARYNEDGSLDISFNGDGKVVSSFGGEWQGQSVTVQADGKIIVAATSSNAGSNFFDLIRYNPDGSLDTSFGSDGLLVTNIPGSLDGIAGSNVVLQPDGKILAAGGNSDFAVARYNNNGTLDTSFGVDGQVTTDVGGEDHVYSMVLQSDGKVLVAGYSLNGTNSNFALVRYNSDGSLDTSFSGDGKILADLGGNDQGYSVAVQPDGKIIVSGHNDSNVALLRFNADGTRDVTFSGDGTVITDIGNATVIGGQTFTGTGVALQDSGKILVSGQSNGDFALVRYNSDGSLDKTFGLSLNTAPLFSESHAGTVTTDLGREDMGRSVVMQPDGKILVAGLADGIGGFLSQPAVKIGSVNYSAANIGYLIGDHALARYNADGSLDTTFNGNGVVTTYFGGNSDYGMGVTLQPDGRILVGGSGFNRNNGTNDFVLARYNSDGTLDTTFSANGKVMIDFSNTNDIGNSIKLQADGKILVAGTSGVVVAGGTSNGNFALARFNADGTLDTSFDGDGKLITDFGGTENAMSVAVQSDGKILVAGSSTATGGNSDFAVARYNIDGTLDTSFSGGGKLTTDFGGNDSVQSVVVQSDGKILVAGSSSMILDGTTINSDFALARYNADGTLDTTFSGDGKLTTDFGGLPDSARIVTLQSDGKIIVGGTRGSGGKSSGFDLVRYNSDGSLDTSFHGEGRLSMDFIFCFSITVQPDGKIVVAGSNDGNSDIHLERFNADGSLDTTFGATSPVYSTPVYIEQGAPVVLDSNLQISDAELAVIGNYEGATLTLTRHGSANADDHFSAPDGSSLGALTEGCDLVTRGINVGTVTTNSGGILAVIFNANATQSLVNAVLQQIAYSNNALSPENSVQIDWTFSDGNSGSQGAGGAMGATSSTTVHIEQYIAPPPPVSTFTNSAPTFFVSDGKVLTDFGKEDIGRSVAVQADGKILVAGLGNGISGFLTSGTTILSYTIGDHAIARYNSDGSLDTTFGVDGKVTTYFGGNSDFAMGIKVQVDGKILIAGSGYDRGGSNTNDFALARYNADGSLDNTFAGSGKVMTDFGGMNDSGQSIALQSDGKILVAGTSTTGNGVVPYSSDFALARYNVDGSLDTTFGDSGKITTDIGGSESGFSVAVQGDGKIIVVGNSAVTVSGVTSQDFAIACYNSDGSLFKKGTLDFGGSETAQSVFVQSDGKILVAGPSSVVVSNVTNMNFALARYNADMTLDTTFDGDGKLITDFGSNDNARSVIVQANGKILVAGNSGSDFALARYNTDGTLDTSFHGTGKLTMDFGGASDTAFSVKLQADGKILVAGSSSIDGNSDFALARFNADGSLDTTFGATNTLNGHPVYTENGTPVVLDSDVRVSDIGLAAVGNYNGATLTLTRHGGATTDDHFSAINGGTLGALTQGGSLVAGGVTVGTVTANSGGTLAVAFNANATVSLVNKVLQQIAYSNGSSTPEASVQIDWTFSDGNTGSQGTGGAMSAVGSTTVHISALNDVIDPSVNTAPTFVVGVGYVTTDFGREDFGRSIAVQPDGKILVAGLGNAVSGYLNASTGNIPFTIGDFALARYNSDGSLDTTFGAEGKLTTYFGGNSDFATGVALQTDGKILVAGTGFNRNNNTNDFALARYNNDGSLDGSFSGNGKVMTDFGGMNDSVNGIKVQPDGKILVLGTSSTPSGVTPSMSDFALARFNADGSLDTTFSGDGKLTTDFGGGTDIGSSVVVLGNGSILAVGSSYVIVNGVSSSNFAVATYTADGTLVSTRTMDIGGNDIARSVAVQGDGKIIVVGDTTAGGNTDFAIIRSTVDGSGPDTTFHGNGMLTTDFGGNDFARSVILQSDGKILVAGNSTLADGTSDFALARYNTDGSLDTSFSGDGKLTLDFGASSDTAFSITLQTDGKILVTGSSSSDGNGDIITARLNADGTLDTTFGIANTLDGTSVYVENGTPVVLDSNVQVIDSQLAASGNFNGATLMLMRHSGASTEDHFSSIGNLGTLAEGNPLLVGGTTVGTVTTNSGGTLAVAFNANATQSLVNAVLQQIAYSNSSHAHAFSVQLDWNFSDGNTGLQGTGGALGVTGITTVQVVPETASMEINFSGTPVGVASANETFNDFYLDPEKLGETGYVASVIDPDGSVQLYDDNGDGTPDRYIWTDILGGQPESGAITYGADGTLTIFGNGGNQLGRLAVDSSGHVVGLYVQDNGGNTPVFISHTLTADTNPEDTLVDTFTISGSDTGRLYDDNSDGTVDRLDIVSAGANQNTSTYALSWSDATHYRANAEHQLDFGAGTDAEGRPTTLIMNGGEQTIHWQSTVVNGLLAEVSSVYGTVSALFSFIDTNNDGKPDEFIYKEVTGSVTTYVAQGILRFDNLPSSLTAVIQSSTDAEDVFIGTVTGSNSTPLEILIPSFNGGNGGNTSSDTLSNNALTFDLGISSPQLDANSQITVKDADFGGRLTSVTLAVISLTLNGSFLTVPLSGTDASGNPYSLPYSGGTRFLVNLPAGIVGQPDPIVKAWQVNSMNNGSYSLLTMTVVSTGGTSGMDWVTGTSGSDSITAGASSDLIEWSGGNDMVDAGDGYDAVNLPLSSMNAFHWLDGNKMLHIGSATNTSLDVYHITKNSDTSFRIDKLGADGTTVESTMNLNNAESMGFGNQIHQFQVNYGNGQYASGTPWDDEIFLNAANIGNLIQVWGDTGTDTFVVDMGPGYSKLEVFENGMTYTLKGTLSDGNVVELGHAVPSNNGYGSIMFFGTGVNAKSISVNDIETVRFVSGAVILDFVPVNDAPTFNVGDGIVTTDFSGHSDFGFGVTTQPDGKILVAGTSIYPTTDADFALLRYNADGTLDSTFGGGQGKILTDFVYQDSGMSVALQPDGKILVAGQGYTGSNSSFIFARYNLDGTLDTTLDSDGKVQSNFGGDWWGTSVTVQSDGKILVAGSTSMNSGINSSFALIRYNTDGSLDTSFDSDGRVITSFSGFEGGRSVELQSDGKILVAGVSNMDFALVRYNTDGTLDTGFSGDGLVATDFGGSDIAQSVALQSDGKIIVAGFSGNGTTNDIALVRYNTDGSLDTTFSGDGKIVVDLGGNDQGYSVAVQSDGKIIVAGHSNSNIVLLRYNTDGTPDITFSGDGIVTTNAGATIPVMGKTFTGMSVSLQPDGKILVTGQSNGDVALLRYNIDGSLDQTFDRVNTLNATPAYTENGTPVVLDNHALIYDSELSSFGSYSGAMLTLMRHGGASAEDLFTGTGTLGTLLQGSGLVAGGTTVGSVTHNSGGLLTVTFNASATQLLVNAVLQQIAYSNSSDAPPVSVQIDWTFSDGNNGIQGSGGVSNATGSTVVQITGVNDAPTLSGFIGAVDTTPENTLVAVTLAEFKSHGDAADVDGTVDAFVIKVVSTGTLKIGIDAATATAWDAAMNNTIDAAHQAYWTPELNAKGTLDAFTVVAMDNSGAESSSAIQATINVTDTTPPAVSIYSPADAATGVAVGSDIVVTFSETIQKGTGLIVIHSDSAIGAVVESYNVATDTTHLTFSGSELTINPTNDLSNGTHYFVTFAEGSLKDLAGNHFAGTDTYDFTTEATSTLHDIHGTVTFWKTGAAISGVNSTLASAPAVSGSQPVEFRNIQVAADGSRTIEIWETSAHADTDSLQLEFVLPTGSVAVWQDATGLPSGWISLPNTGIAGQFILGGMGITALSAGSVKLGTLTLTAPTNPQHFELALTSGELGTDIVPAFGIVSDSMTTGLDGFYQHLDMADSTYALTSAKVSGIDESNAVRANDALAALKIAVEMNPNADGTAISPYQYLAADVNHDGQVKAADALNILKMAVQLDTAPANEWLFVPESVGSESMTRNNVIWPDNPTLITLNHDLELNLIGIVKGDVDGSWVA